LQITEFSEEELMSYTKGISASLKLMKATLASGNLPVVNFAAGGMAIPADAALMMQLGMDGILVGSGTFESDNPIQRAVAVDRATTHSRDPQMSCRHQP